MNKAEWRRWAHERAAQMDKKALQQADKQTTEQLLNLPEWNRAHCVFLYVSVGWEPDTHAAIREAFKSGKRVCVPSCQGKGIMLAQQITSLEELAPATFGLLEPGEDAPVVQPGEIDLAVVPCLCCDEEGYRLGNGGGYYDRYLTALATPKLCLCRSELLVQKLPVESYDIPVDAVLTEKGTFCISATQ